MEQFLSGVERRAFRMAQLATGDRDEAMDLVQEAMLKLVQKYGEKPEAEWPPLFYRILQSRILDWHRRATVRNRVRHWFGRTEDEDQDEDPLEQLPDPAGDDPAQVLANHRAMLALDEALRALPLRQQQAFLLRAWEGLDTAETARAMGCSEGSVKTHYSRAVHTLRERLGDHWP